MKTICLYMHVHQPYRIRRLEASDMGVARSIFDAGTKEGANNRAIIDIRQRRYTSSALPRACFHVFGDEQQGKTHKCAHDDQVVQLSDQGNKVGNQVHRGHQVR